MAKKNKLVLHIGSHKTGTTTIQIGLNEKRDALARHGFGFAIVPPFANLHQALGFIQHESLVPRGLHVTNPVAMLQAFDAEAFDNVIDRKSTRLNSSH